MSTEMTTRDKVERVKGLIQSRMDSLSAILPRYFMTGPRFAQVILTLCGRNTKLLDCNEASLVGAVLQCAALGLDPEPALGQAYFVPYKGIVQMQIGYRGFANLGWRSGQLASLSMNVVRDGDDFDYELGTAPFLRHKPKSTSSSAITHAYATAKPIGGETMFEALTKDDVDNIRARSPSSRSEKSSPWDTDFSAMAKKSAFRRLGKLLPLATEQSRPLAKALDFDERAEIGLKQHLDTEIIDVIGKEAEQTEEEPGSNG